MGEASFILEQLGITKMKNTFCQLLLLSLIFDPEVSIICNLK
jgi:hypothetical protein